MDLRDSDLVQLGADLEAYKRQIEGRVHSAKQAKDSADQWLRTCSSSLDTANELLKNAENRAADAERERDNAQIGVRISNPVSR